MTPYITFREQDANGINQYYILQKEFPNYIGIIVTNPYYEAILKVPVTGHKMYVAYWGVLKGRYVPSHLKVDEDILIEFQKMATWFYDNRILTDEKKYKKWKL